MSLTDSSPVGMSEAGFGAFTERQAVYSRAAMTIADMAHVPFDRLPMGEQFKLNTIAEDYVMASRLLIDRHGEGAYSHCHSTEEQVAYCLYLKFGARWDKIERMAWFLHEMNHYRQFREQGAVHPEFPFGDSYKGKR